VKDDIDVLPSFILTYALNPKSNLRLGGSQSVNRPEFRELAEYSVYDYENYITVRGNPNLVRAKNTNADLRYEFFPSSGEILSASVFYKYFSNPIEQVNKGNDVFSFENADHATSVGAELEVRKRLDFIKGDFFNHLTAYANAAYINGDVKFGTVSYNSPLQGQSPYLVNGGLTYSSDNDNFSVNLLYNKIGPRLRARAVAGAAFNQYEKPRDVLDLQVSKKFIHNRLEAKITVSDLLGQSYNWYYKFEPNPSSIGYNAKEDVIVNSYKYGTSAKLSLKYNLGK
jgi:Outer membrane protein beta-barrel family